MRKSRITIIVFFSVVGILLVAYFIMNSGEKRYQWYESYRADSDQPYGTLFLKRMLESYKPGGHLILNDKKSLPDLLPKHMHHTSYVLVGESLYFNKDDKEALLKFLEAGNDAFIATLDPPDELLRDFYNRDECGDRLRLDSNHKLSATMNFYHDSLYHKDGYQYSYRFGAKDEFYTWHTFVNSIFCDSTKLVVPLGYHHPKAVNFIRISYGKGKIYLHCNPIVFTNYFMSKSDKMEYAASVFSHLKGKDIIWDEYSKVPFAGNDNAYNSPLYFILQQPSLKYAWWLLLGTVVLYVLFAIKRTQRVIPVLDIKTNTSIEFINQISILYFQNGNHLDMARKKMKYFLFFIRSKYGMNATTFTDAQVERLAEKSKVNTEEVRTIFKRYQIIEQNSSYNIPDYRLLDLYYAIESFYNQCK